MDENKNREEQEVARLIRSGLPSRTRPDPAAKRLLLVRLEREMELSRNRYPNVALGALAALWCMVIALAVYRLSGMSGVGISGDLWPLLTFPLVTNVLIAPVAAIVIVIGRRKHGKA